MVDVASLICFTKPRANAQRDVKSVVIPTGDGDSKMGLVLEGIMARMGAGPLPEAVVMTPPRGVTRSNVTQQWLPAQHSGEAPHHSREPEPPATNGRPAARQAVVPPAADEEARRGRAMEAAVKAMLATGGEAMLQLLKNQGHKEVVGMLTGEGPEPSAHK